MINQIIHGDCFDVLKNIPDSSIDLILTDPPYGLSFMGKNWDHGVPGVQFWIEALRVAKPGAHLFAFGGTRTFHRLAVAIEDAGWEIRDTIMWVYGSGFPKSLDVSKAIDKMAGANREVVGSKEVSDMRGGNFKTSNGRILVNITAPATEDAKQWQGWGTALKPALEPITVARKPLTGTVAENVLEHGTGAINIDGCRVECEGKPVFINGVERDRNRSSYDTGGSNRTGKITTQGRWPANLIHDGSEEVVGLFPYQKSGKVKPHVIKRDKTVVDFQRGLTQRTGHSLSSEGSAARFFYCAKASKSERGEGNTHPTVKPLGLMKYLITLGLPPGGIVLDPFCGSGTTALACKELGRNYICIEKELEYYQIACNRLDQPIEPIPDEPIEEPVDNSPLQLKLF
jgi:site-specific DNA-methyltransferase (adenine-specific)